MNLAIAFAIASRHRRRLYRRLFAIWAFRQSIVLDLSKAMIHPPPSNTVQHYLRPGGWL